MESDLVYSAEPSTPDKEAGMPAAPDFRAINLAFAHKSDHELRLGYWLFRLVAHPGLMRMGTCLARWAVKSSLPLKFMVRNTIFKLFCGGESVQEALKVIKKMEESNVHTVLDYAAEGEESEAGFENVKNQILQNIGIGKEEKGIGAISVKLSGLGYPAIYEKMAQRQELEQEEKEAFQRTGLRLEAICREAASAGILVYLDAEESWLQEPMDALAEQMMSLFNKEKAIVFNTLQMYRTDRLSYLQELIARTSAESFHLGIKLVRGAYWEKESKRAFEEGLPSPVFETKEETDYAYNEAILLCLAHLPKVQLCIATHNQASTELLVKEILHRGIQQQADFLYFSQLYGMSDNLSYALGKAGFNVSKYLPYGAVEKALPYLIRRAEENTAIAGQMGRELQLLQAERARRRSVKRQPRA